jgi:hypothetical protein
VRGGAGGRPRGGRGLAGEVAECQCAIVGGEHVAGKQAVAVVEEVLDTTAPALGRSRVTVSARDQNRTDIFRPYSRPNSFREVLIRPYPSPDI